MGFGTDFTAKAFLNRQIFHSIEDVNYAISEVEQTIQTNRELLLMLAMSNAKDICTEEEDVLYATRNRVNDLIDDLTQQEHNLALLTLYKDAIEDGTAKFEEDGKN